METMACPGPGFAIPSRPPLPPLPRSLGDVLDEICEASRNEPVTGDVLPLGGPLGGPLGDFPVHRGMITGAFVEHSPPGSGAEKRVFLVVLKTARVPDIGTADATPLRGQNREADLVVVCSMAASDAMETEIYELVGRKQIVRRFVGPPGSERDPVIDMSSSATERSSHPGKGGGREGPVSTIVRPFTMTSLLWLWDRIDTRGTIGPKRPSTHGGSRKRTRADGFGSPDCVAEIVANVIKSDASVRRYITRLQSGFMAPNLERLTSIVSRIHGRVQAFEESLQLREAERLWSNTTFLLPETAPQEEAADNPELDAEEPPELDAEETPEFDAEETPGSGEVFYEGRGIISVDAALEELVDMDGPGGDPDPAFGDPGDPAFGDSGDPAPHSAEGDVPLEGEFVGSGSATFLI